ncbi:uncharacterized protein LOC143035665 [Oratosquilla oratoria]|uniref:uncharacterized protein LOC143035665 n=1 Tax=Oratosquilla oratoria TaxID=337810 RepID=UPI003F75C299
MDLSTPPGADADLTLHELHWVQRATQATKKTPGADRVTYPLLQHLPPSMKGSLPTHQAGFRKGKSITDHIIRLSEHIRRAQRHKKKKRVLHTYFLNIAKAFDTVWHAKLPWKWKSLRVSPAMYKFVRSFLSGRSISVRRDGTLSAKAPIDMRPPQCSVVAPFPFTLLLADVGNGVRGDTVVTSYVDDIALWRKSRHRRPKKDSAQHRAELRSFECQVDLIVIQFTSLGFSLSAAKTTYMPVHQIGYNIGTYPDWNHIKVCGTTVKPARSVLYLGTADGPSLYSRSHSTHNGPSTSSEQFGTSPGASIEKL